jgi:hypothetical protein
MIHINARPVFVIALACALFMVLAVMLGRCEAFELTPVDSPLEDVVDRPIEFRSMEAVNYPEPVDLDQLETDMLEHGWKPAKVHDIMQDLRSGQQRYNAICDDWRTP